MTGGRPPQRLPSAVARAPRPRPLVLALAAVQVALPLSLLAVRWAGEGSRPMSELPASWQMYSSVTPARYDGIDTGGRVRRLDVTPLPKLVRAVDVGRVVPDRLCDAAADLLAVRRTGGPDPGMFPC